MAQPLLSTHLQPLPAPAATATATATVRRGQPNFTHLISTATSLPHLKQIHAQLLKTPQQQHHLFDLLLSSLSFPSYALSLLASIPHHRPLTPQLTGEILKRLSRSNDPYYTLLFFQTMQNNAFPIDCNCFLSLLKAAPKAMALKEARMIHGLAAKFGCASNNLFVETALVHMYSAFELIPEARLVFDKMSDKNIVAWHVMIDGYCQSGLFGNVLALLEEMKRSGVEPDQRLFTTILSACARFGDFVTGKVVHGFISENNIVIDSHLQSALINMYATSGSMYMAQNLYDKLKPNNKVASTAMIHGYTKVGNVEAARLIFNEMVDKDSVCWTAMIYGYAANDKPQESLNMFYSMQKHGIKPDERTILSVISALKHFGALGQAKRVHQFVDENGFGKSLLINNSLIDMYAKCGSLEEAKRVFDLISQKNGTSWTGIITAFAFHEDFDNALKHFRQMKLEKVWLNWLTFVGVLLACSHAGLVEEGEWQFESMINRYGITPKLEHYECMVDLYGRANRLTDAVKIIENMPMAPNDVIWESLMAACRKHGEFELGSFAAERILELDPDHDGAHFFLSNIYGKEKLENVGKGSSKKRECSLIEMDGEIHVFWRGDRKHKRTDEIYEKLDEVIEKLKKVGYSRNSNSVKVDLDENEGKRETVLLHSEKLALCYGLISGEKQSSIRIVKNRRICEDCHDFMKFASKVYDKEIVVRDRSRFHHFRDGTCSCKDYENQINCSVVFKRKKD